MKRFTIVFLMFGALASADTFYLRNSEPFRALTSAAPRQIRIDVNGNIQTYDVDGQLRSIDFSEHQQHASPPPPPPPAPPSYQRDRAGYVAQPSAPPPTALGVTIPVDTPVTIRMIEAVNSQTARLGQTFRASIDEPIFVNGQSVIPRGADVLAKLVEDQQSGKIEGRTVLTLALVSISVNGQPVAVTSSDVKTESSSREALEVGGSDWRRHGAGRHRRRTGGRRRARRGFRGDTGHRRRSSD